MCALGHREGAAQETNTEDQGPKLHLVGPLRSVPPMSTAPPPMFPFGSYLGWSLGPCN